MKERIIKPEGLTKQAQEGYSKSAPRHDRDGDIFMEVKSDMPPNSQPISPERAENRNLKAEKSSKPVSQEKSKSLTGAESPLIDLEQIVDKEVLRKEWYAAFTPEELKNADTRATIEAAIRLGYGPQKETSKGAKAIRAREVIENALLGDEDRIEKVEEILQLKLSPEQKQAFLKAHYVGSGEEGKDGGKAGVYNYTAKQLLEKARILKNEVRLTEEQRRILMEAGLAATPIPVNNYADPILQNIVRELNAEVGRVGVGRPLDPRFVDEQLARVRNLVDAQRVNGQEGLDLLTELNAWMNESLQAQGEDRGRYFNTAERRAILTNSDERERVFEEIFIGVDANPGVQFETAMGLEPRGRLDEFYATLSHARIFDNNGNDITDLPNAVAQVAKERERLTREFSARGEIRRVLHNANWSVSMGGGDIDQFAQAMSTFQSEYVDLIFADPLVSTAMHMFEQSFQQIKAENNGRLPYEELAWDFKKGESNLENRVWDLMRKGIEAGTVPTVSEWRLRRSIILARGFGVISLRFPEIAATARLPEETPLAGAYEKAEKLASIYGEAVARYLDPLEHVIEKFNIGENERALLYFFLTGDKSHFESTDQLREALKMGAHLEGSDKRLIDIINLWRIGGPFSQSSWRVFTSMKGMSPEDVQRSGLGMREARVGGDLEDEVIGQENDDPNWSGKSEKERAGEVKTRMKNKESLKNIERLDMWKDALKANPLRVMWTLETKEPGRRMQFLREALGNISQDEVKQIEQDLMIIQENTVTCLQLPQADPRRIVYGNAPNAPEMLKYDIIGGNNPTPADNERQRRVRLYVEKIRQEASASNYRIIKSFFEKTPAEGTPFPFVIGMEDIPFSDFNFINTGGRGFFRRINDYANSVKATNELTGLILKIPTSHNIEPLIESIAKIKEAVSNYDRRIAMEILPFIEEGIIRVYDKDVLARLPGGIGAVVSLLKDSSFAQEAFSREAMSWDEGDKFNFTRHLMQNNLADKADIIKLRKRVGATYANVGVDILRTYGQLALLLLAYEMAKGVVPSEK